MIETSQLLKSFQNGRTSNIVLRGIDVQIEQGEFVAIMGRSGAGKSTFLYQISLLDRPTSGQVIVDGIDTTGFSERKRARYRLENMGYVFQYYALLPELTALEQVMAPLLMLGYSWGKAKKRSLETLDSLGIIERQRNLPSQLSGGEQQRVSIARAIANEPKILFADEPTANLDSQNAENVLEILDDLHDKGQTIVMVTHERDYGNIAERILMMDDGKIVEEINPKHKNHRSPKSSSPSSSSRRKTKKRL